jgi:hypothetical protein
MAAPNPAPPDRAARLVPANVLLYVHATIGRDRDRRLFALAERFAAFRTLRDRALERVDVRPWLGNEAAFALLPGREPLLLASVRDPRKAEAWRARQTTPTAFAGGFMLIGSQAAIGAAQHRHAALADAPSFKQAAKGRPQERTLDAYATATALQQLLPQRLRALAERPGLEAVGATLASADHGARLTLRAVGGAGDAATFEPKLLDRIPSGAAAYIGLGAGSELLAVAREAGLGPLLDVLQRPAREEAGVDLRRDLIGPLDEVALAAWSRDGAPVAALAATTRSPELLQPSYRLDRDTAILASHPSALAHPRASLAQNPHFGRVLPSNSPRAEALAFFDLRQLLALGVLTGAVAPGVSADLADLRLVRAAGAVVRREKADTTAELFLEIP